MFLAVTPFLMALSINPINIRAMWIGIGDNDLDGGMDEKPKRSIGNNGLNEGTHEKPKRGIGGNGLKEGTDEKPKRGFGGNGLNEGTDEKPKRGIGGNGLNEGTDEKPKRGIGGNGLNEGTDEKPKRGIGGNGLNEGTDEKPKRGIGGNGLNERTDGEPTQRQLRIHISEDGAVMAGRHVIREVSQGNSGLQVRNESQMIKKPQDVSFSGDGINHIPTTASVNSITDSSSHSLPERHCHEKKSKPDVDKRARRKLIIACVLSLIFMIGEVFGGVFAHSLAIVSDAAHLLTDLASFLISLLALYLSSRRATKKLSFGWYRVEILGALMSILFLWVVTGVLCYMAVDRVLHQDFEVDATIMLITAGCGVGFNLVMGLTLHPGHHGHSHGDKNHSNGNHDNYEPDLEKVSLTQSADAEQRRRYGSLSDHSVDYITSSSSSSGHSHTTNINVKAAFIHTVGDLLQSIGVLIAAIIIYFKPEWKLADPICTFLFSVIVLVTTLSIMRDILVVLMEGTPRGVDFKAIYFSLKQIPEVKDIHDLRIWSLSMDKWALSVHLAVSRSTDTYPVLQAASSMIQQKFGIVDTTVQIEEYVDDMMDCTHCKDLPD